MLFDSWRRRVLARFDLRHDQAEVAEIDATFRSGVEFRGTNLWVLIFAILIASIGLNVNSTAVIIGAMLISPLMGPIMALGYGAGINDSALMRSALFNLGLAALISLVTSALYFVATPLAEAHSELLARTTPSIWDVLIALCGGLAGAIGITRKVRSNVLPGVAIATALMPPLCTAGYGLAVGNLAYFLGAFYLFSINCVFIAIATLMMVKLMALPSVRVLRGRSIKKRRTVIGAVVLLTILPSFYLAAVLVQKEWFVSNANRFTATVFGSMSSVLVASKDVNFDRRQVRILLAGEPLSDTVLADLKARLPEFGLTDTELIVRQSSQPLPDMNALKTDILKDLLQSNTAELQTRDTTIATLQSEISQLRSVANTEVAVRSLVKELAAQFPSAADIRLAHGVRASDGKPVILVDFRMRTPVSAAEQLRLRRWLMQRFDFESVDQVGLQIQKK